MLRYLKMTGEMGHASEHLGGAPYKTRSKALHKPRRATVVPRSWNYYSAFAV